MTLIIAVRKDGSLICVVPEEGYIYHVYSWSSFFSATGTNYMDDYKSVIVRAM